MDSRKIKSVEFLENKSNWVGNKMVRATFEDGTVWDVFAFYSDELSFTEAELTGKTVAEACEMKRLKDVDYLRS